MRVQPHFPSKPLLATVTSRSGLALCACSAANSPAPPEPRIKMSVSRRSRVMGLSEHFPEKACPGLDPGWVPVFRRKCDQIENLEHAREEDECDHGGQGGCDRRKLLLPITPIEI